MSRTVPIQTTDKARYHASVEGVVEYDFEHGTYEIREESGNYSGINKLVSSLEGRRVHIIVFVEN